MYILASRRSAMVIVRAGHITSMGPYGRISRKSGMHPTKWNDSNPIQGLKNCLMRPQLGNARQNTWVQYAAAMSQIPDATKEMMGWVDGTLWLVHARIAAACRFLA